MSWILIATTLVSFVIAGTALALPMADKEKCISSVGIVQEMLANSDSGDKEQGMVKTLIELSTGLCDRNRYEEA